MKAFCLKDAIFTKIAHIQSSETIKHLKSANKEVLLAIRSLIDTAVREIEKSEKKSEGTPTEAEK